MIIANMQNENNNTRIALVAASITQEITKAHICSMLWFLDSPGMIPPEQRTIYYPLFLWVLNYHKEHKGRPSFESDELAFIQKAKEATDIVCTFLTESQQIILLAHLEAKKFPADPLTRPAVSSTINLIMN